MSTHTSSRHSLRMLLTPWHCSSFERVVWLELPIYWELTTSFINMTAYKFICQMKFCVWSYGVVACMEILTQMSQIDYVIGIVILKHSYWYSKISVFAECIKKFHLRAKFNQVCRCSSSVSKSDKIFHFRHWDLGTLCPWVSLFSSLKSQDLVTSLSIILTYVTTELFILS